MSSAVTPIDSGPTAAAAATTAVAQRTADRVVDAALVAFGRNGYAATSLDDLAAELGIRKQSILYHHASKEILLDAVIDRAVAELMTVFDTIIATSDGGFARVEAMVRGVFRLAIRRPELLGLLREITRLGPPALTRATAALEPLISGATAWLDREMDEGRVRRSDPRLLAFSVYSTVMGVATEVEVLRAVGLEPTLRETVVRRRELLRFLQSALTEPAPSPVAT
ncbi:MAG: TetR/AcrR family transcriptional regulator [Acidimicrobiales bacterium]